MEKDELLSAIQNNDIESVKRLAVEGLGIDANLLHYAVQLGNLEMVKTLLLAGAQKWVNVFDEMAITPLMWAVRKNDLALVKVLLDAGSEVNLHDVSRIGNTALRDAASEAGFEIVFELIRAGADPKIPGWMQLTPLDVAVERLRKNDNDENRKIVTLLSGAN